MQTFNPEDIVSFERFLARLAGLVSTRRIYNADHPRVIEQSTLCFESYELWRASAQPTRSFVHLVIRGERLFLERMPLPDTASQLQLLVESTRAAKCVGFKLNVDLDQSGLDTVADHVGKALSTGITDDPPAGWEWIDPESFNQLDANSSSGGCGVDGIEERDVLVDQLRLALPTLSVDTNLYTSTVNELHNFMTHYEDRASDLGEIHDVTEKLVSKVVGEPNLILPVVTVPYGDDYSYRHSVNVCVLTLAAARRITRDEDQLQRIGEAALLHDLGKSRTPPEILHKKGRLTEEELKIIQRHPVDGARMIHGLSEVDPLAVAVAFGHHIRERGAGYPKVPNSYRLGPITQLVQVVDIFEALTGHRPYKSPMSARAAFRLLYNDPELESRRHYIDLLYDAIGAEPVGTKVEVDGARGIVCGYSDDRERARIQLVDKQGHGLEIVEVDRKRSESRVLST